MSLLVLSNELLLLIAKDIDNAKSLYNFHRANQRLATLLKETLYRTTAESKYAINALACAIVTRNEDMLRVLLEKGTPITIKADATTIIHQGSTKCDDEAIRQALEKGANIIVYKGRTKYCSGKERPALHWASRAGNVGMVEMLLASGADISAQDKSGWAALHHAADSGCGRVVNVLLAMGAHTSIRTNNVRGVSPLDLAIQNGSKESIKLILESSDPAVPYMENNTMPLHAAAAFQDDDVALVKLLLSKGANIVSEDSDGNSALGYAVHKGNEKVVRFLLNEGAIVNDAAYSVLYQPNCWYERHPWLLAVAKTILENVPANFSGTTGKAPLRFAVEYHDEDLVLSLLKRGADVNARDRDRTTPLHMAAWRGRDDLVKILLKYGADIHAKDRSSETALHSAMRDNKWFFYGENSPDYRGSVEVTKLLVDAGININARCNGARMTALHRAAENPFADVEAVTLLLNRGADATLRTAGNYTARTLAWRSGNDSMIKLLQG